MRSMTGYGEASAETPRWRLAVSLRGVNHRFLDLVIRVREELRGGVEPALRDLLARELERGRVELGVDAQPLEKALALEVDREGLETLAGQVQSLVDAGLIAQGLTAADLLRLPQLVRLEAEAAAWEPEDQEALLAVTGQALAQLLEAREAEGARLAALLEERIDGLEAALEDLRSLREEAKEHTARALEERLREALEERLDRELDPDRLAHEVAILVDRSDVAEELDRLGAHLEHFREVMAQEGPVGKRLDFLAQEIFREINTVGSKCRDSAMTRRVLDAKTLCEQVREQVQNVE